MALIQKRVALANGIELDVVDEGPRGGETLIFLHGFPESHRTWRHQIPHLSDRYRCIAPDQRGYRASSRPAGIDAYTPDKLIGDVFLLADALGVDKFTVVGHDWGGAIAWGVAIGGQGARVERAIIANAPHPVIFQKLLYTNQVQRQASQYMRAFRDAGHDPFIREHGLAEFLRREAEWESASAMEPEERAAQLRDWSDPETGIAMLNWYRASQIDVPPMDAPFDVPEGFAPPMLPNLDIPTLVIWALDDMALPPENLDGLDRVIKDPTLVKVPDCGHFVPWEAPEKVNAAIDDFLGRTGG
ncbi:alpha/beta fold hydrolase [Altererythrobacter luteolus]|uniref:Alpha/beta fold hydrolase n=1 Tax=Pontixanthobacter luteolus TaxID=295089 RepID=A0A6I4V1W1_9SPHN|nr:alpha/beta hydrolase [Pontixanthobacter luteolus]MXP47046.1 alpha/beta fold hydrolase [Pontixanthobacter luteolus]